MSLTVTQEQSTVVSVSIPVETWLAALSVEGGRVVDGWWSGWRLPRTYWLAATASRVMTQAPLLFSSSAWPQDASEAVQPLLSRWLETVRYFRHRAGEQDSLERPLPPAGRLPDGHG